MRMNSQDRYNAICNERIEMLKNIKDYIQNKSMDAYYDTEVFNVIVSQDEKAIKEYNTIREAQSIIYKLTQEIKDTNNIDDIVLLRKKVNYYINKIKREMKKRELSEAEIENYNNNTAYLRNGVAKYIRFLKREKNIVEIGYLFDSNSKEDQKKLKRMISNEKRFNDNFSLDKKATPVKSKKKTEEKSSIKDEEDVVLVENNTDTNKETNYDDFEFDFGEPKDTTIDTAEFDKWVMNDLSKYPNKTNVGKPIPTVCLLEGDPFYEDYSDNEEMKYDYLTRRVNLFKKCYHVDELYGYNGSFVNNCVSFVRNIPRCVKNKKTITLMKDDYGNFYPGSDLLSYIEYSKKRNSIMRSFGQLFSKSALFSKANKCLNDHDRCVEWVMDFLNKNNLDLSVPVKR